MDTYKLFTISEKKDLAACPDFHIRHYYWNSKITPIVIGKMAYLDQQGLYCAMTCHKPPVPGKYFNHQEPVYEEDAMELFLQLSPPSHENNVPNYINIELNTNGAILAQVGPDRLNRRYLSSDEIDLIDLELLKQDNQWTIKLLISDALIHRLFSATLSEKPEFKANFYKIRETGDDIHFGTCFPVTSKEPNFHLPEFFGQIVYGF